MVDWNVTKVQAAVLLGRVCVMYDVLCVVIEMSMCVVLTLTVKFAIEIISRLQEITYTVLAATQQQ